MSEGIIRVIPANETTIFPQSVLDKVTAYLNSRLNAESIRVMIYDKTEFVDCGSNMEKIVCPVCGLPISFEWWGEAMGKASSTGFSDLSVKLPCCGEDNSLNDLKYHFSCGFARWVIEIVNPSIAISKEVMEEIELLVGTKLRLIEAHY